jgi:DNA polymerase I-like protein with 3'-5' exonuclease and polymerase domains
LFGDEQIVEMYRAQAEGVDMHSNNAREVFGRWLGWKVPEGLQYGGLRVDAIPVAEFKAHPFGKVCRDLIKAVWYGLAYGKFDFSTLRGADGKMIGRELSQRMREALLDAVPGMRSWFRWVERFVRKHHGIYSLGGRWCDLSAEMSSFEEWMHRRAFRRAFNFPMQATGAELIGDAMVRLLRDPEFRALGYRLCLQVHDELVTRGPLRHVERAGEILRHHMVSATANGTRLLLDLQVSVGHGPNYFEAK